MVLNFKQIYSDSWNLFKKNWWEYVVVTIIMGLLSLIPFIGVFLQLFMYFLVLNAILKSIKGEDISFSNFFDFKKITNQKVITIFIAVAVIGLLIQSVSTDIATALIISLAILILMVLFFPIFCVMLDKNLGIKDTIVNSLQLTKGARIDILILMILNFLIGILGVILLFVGTFIAIPIVTISTVVTYKSLQSVSENI